jgi:hypothetical protein
MRGTSTCHVKMSIPMLLQFLVPKEMALHADKV